MEILIQIQSENEGVDNSLTQEHRTENNVASAMRCWFQLLKWANSGREDEVEDWSLGEQDRGMRGQGYCFA